MDGGGDTCRTAQTPAGPSGYTGRDVQSVEGPTRFCLESSMF
ncbi:MAG: hypothetical protein PHV04_08905 [Clostridia bacterium]|nr:hypothetical protein [Clostridia bacterium]